MHSMTCSRYTCIQLKFLPSTMTTIYTLDLKSQWVATMRISARKDNNALIATMHVAASYMY